MFLFSHFLANFSQERILQRNYAGRKAYKMNFTVITSIYNPIRITTYLQVFFAKNELHQRILSFLERSKRCGQDWLICIGCANSAEKMLNRFTGFAVQM